MANHLQGFVEKFNNETFRHLLFNYSESEIGFRHPKGPVGVVARDQGILDNYAGPTRLLLTTDGTLVGLAKNIAFICDDISFVSKSINNFYINGKTINQNFFTNLTAVGTKLPTISNIHVIEPGRTKVINGEIVGSKPLSEVFDLEAMFKTPSKLPTPEEEKFSLFKKVTGLLAK